MNNSPKTRASLILRLRHPEDAVAWEEFVEIYQPLVFRLARAKGLQEADALDLTQEVLAKVANAVNSFNPCLLYTSDAADDLTRVYLVVLRLTVQQKIR